MKVSTKGRYGLRALVDLAVHSEEKHVSLASIANRQKISLNYLEQVFAPLKKAGIIKSIKGPQGGYCLAEQPKDIKISAVLQVLEGKFDITGDTPCSGKNDEISSALWKLVWEPVNRNVNSYLERTTLEDLAEEYKRLNMNRDDMLYYI